MIPWIIVGVFGLMAGIFMMQAQSKQKQLDKNGKNLEQSRSFADSLQQKTKSNKAELDTLRKENRDLKSKQKEHRKKMQTLREEHEELEKSLEELQNDTSGHSELVELREQLEEFHVRRSELERERSQLSSEYEKRLGDMQSGLVNDKQRLERDNKQFKRDLNAANRRVAKLENDFNREKKRVGGEKSQMKRLETRASNNDRAFRVTQNELHRVHRQLRELVEENTQMKQQLKAGNTASPAVEEAKSTLSHNLGLNDTEMFESSAEEFIESLDATSSEGTSDAPQASGDVDVSDASDASDALDIADEAVKSKEASTETE